MINRARIKQSLPSVLHAPLGALATYLSRLRIWAGIAVSLRGAGLRDRIVLLGSSLAAPCTALRGLREWRDPYLLRDAMIVVPGVGTFRCRAGTDDLWHVVPQRESAVFHAIACRLAPGDCFVDAGANIGIYTILAARRVGMSGRVVAIEMMPGTARILRDHVALNRATRVEVVERALADRANRMMTAYVSEGKMGQASITAAARQDGKRAVEVKTTTLDDLLREISSVRVMKMDLEGAEEFALRGATESIGRIESIILESADDDGPAARFLREHAFALRRLDGRNLLATKAPGDVHGCAGSLR